METGTEATHLVKSDLALTRETHGNSALGTELRNEITLGEVLVLQKKTNNRPFAIILEAIRKLEAPLIAYCQGCL